MKKRLAFIIMVLVCGVVLMSVGGCKDKSAEDGIVKTDAEYKDQAEKDINKDNMLDELDELEKTVDADTE